METESKETTKITALETSLVVQWLRLCTSKARGAGSIPVWGTKIPQAILCVQKTKRKQDKKQLTFSHFLGTDRPVAVLSSAYG